MLLKDVDAPDLNTWDTGNGGLDDFWYGMRDELVCTAATTTMYGHWLIARREGNVLWLSRLGGAPFPLRREAYMAGRPRLAAP